MKKKPAPTPTSETAFYLCLLLLLVAFFSSCSIKQATVVDETGNISTCLVLNKKAGETFKDGRNHIYTIK